MNSMDVLYTLKNKWLVIIIFSLVGASLASGYALSQKPEYNSTATLYASVDTSLATPSGAYQANLASQQLVKSYVELAKNPNVIRDIVGKTNGQATVDEIAGGLTAVVEPSTVLLQISVINSNPARAKLIADASAEVFTELVARLSTPPGSVVASVNLYPIGEASFPEDSISPGLQVFVAAGILVGALTGLLVSLLLVHLDRRVRSPGDLTADSAFVFLGEIPQSTELSQGNLANFRKGASRSTEAFRTLRTNLQFCSIDSPPRLIMLTSANSGEGKTTTAVNTAAALAETGDRVCLVDLDMRRPRVASCLGLSQTVGVTTVLTDSAQLENVLQQCEDSDFDVLTTGPLPPNPSELIASDAMTALLDQLKSQYDYVVVDAPPVMAVTDPVLLSRKVDGVLLVVRWNRTTTDDLKSAINSLDRVSARVLGTVLSATPKDKSKGARNQKYYGFE